MRTAIALSLLFLAGCASAPHRTSAPVAEQSLDALAARRAVFVGEFHDDAAHHRYQHELLMAMATARADAPLALGLEMFQRPYQRHLDDYIARRIDERTMLRRTEYFTRWGFQYTEYAPLWRTCRALGVPVIALNAPKEASRPVGRGGLEALPDSQRPYVATEIDLTDEAHRARILAVFQGGSHVMPEERLQNLYEAMTVWDETMAESAARWLNQGGRIMVVAGSQHVQQRTGIPARTERRVPGLRATVVVLRTEGRESPGDPEDLAELGDFLLRLPPVEARERSLFGAALKFRPEGMEVTKLVEGGSAAASGVEVGDVLTHLGDARITDLTDLRYILDAAAPGTRLPARLSRGMETVTVDLGLRGRVPPPVQ